MRGVCRQRGEEERQGASRRRMIVGRGDLKVNSNEFQVCLETGQYGSDAGRLRASVHANIDSTNLPFETLRIE